MHALQQPVAVHHRAHAISARRFVVDRDQRDAFAPLAVLGGNHAEQLEPGRDLLDHDRRRRDRRAPEQTAQVAARRCRRHGRDVVGRGRGGEKQTQAPEHDRCSDRDPDHE
jgi:hypothetical protein